MAEDSTPSTESGAPAEKAGGKATPEGKGDDRPGSRRVASQAGPREIRQQRGGRPSRDGGRGRPSSDEQESRYEERVVKINRCATVVKGGRRFSFSALVVVGDRGGSVGVGFGKAKEVPPSVEKAMKDARKNMTKILLDGNTIPHKVVGVYRSSRVVLLPASEGTGVIAGASVRAVVECTGIKNVLSKVHGSANPLNVVKATLEGLGRLRNIEEVSRLRGVEITR